METKIHISLIKYIKSLNPDEFIQWYNNTIQYGSNLVNDNKIINHMVKLSTNDKYLNNLKYFELHKHNNNDYRINDLLYIIIDDLDYFVQKCKNNLVKNILEDAKLFEINIDVKPEIMTNELRETFGFISKQISSYTYNTQACNSETNELADYVETSYKFVI